MIRYERWFCVEATHIVCIDAWLLRFGPGLGGSNFVLDCYFFRLIALCRSYYSTFFDLLQLGRSKQVEESISLFAKGAMRDSVVFDQALFDQDLFSTKPQMQKNVKKCIQYGYWCNQTKKQCAIDGELEKAAIGATRSSRSHVSSTSPVLVP